MVTVKEGPIHWLQFNREVSPATRIGRQPRFRTGDPEWKRPGVPLRNLKRVESFQPQQFSRYKIGSTRSVGHFQDISPMAALMARIRHEIDVLVEVLFLQFSVVRSEQRPSGSPAHPLQLGWLRSPFTFQNSPEILQPIRRLQRERSLREHVVFQNAEDGSVGRIVLRVAPVWNSNDLSLQIVWQVLQSTSESVADSHIRKKIGRFSIGVSPVAKPFVSNERWMPRRDNHHVSFFHYVCRGRRNSSTHIYCCSPRLVFSKSSLVRFSSNSEKPDIGTVQSKVLIFQRTNVPIFTTQFYKDSDSRINPVMVHGAEKSRLVLSLQQCR
ncbi:unnamed protein product [Nesidiocoris tenuis]|uniref:Uncharacterized protein n=1 Tax=Nesidiocoris tenuis TaxID=355587 RepID=A0A6H5GZE2_9HEMI|nr:unnamed protein product [Nesidiocoris tenuis]